MKKSQLFIVLCALVIAMSGCGQKKNADSVQEPVADAKTVETPVVEDPVIPVETHENEIVSPLTGEWVSDQLKNQRPYAIVFNNIEYASPQSGTSQASILYEAVVEGGITRMLGIYEGVDSDRIGSIRSARHYMVSFADEYDAIFVHFGHTKYALAKIDELGVDNLSGLSGIGTTVFYRDHAINAPHNAFTSTKGILAGIKKLGYRTEHKEGYETGHFQFYKEDTDLTSESVVRKIALGYSNYTTPTMEYNENDKLYYRNQFGQPHIDKNTGKQLAFKNVIIQLVKEWNIDKNGYQTMDIENSSGEGYYISNGRSVKITWQKNESTSKMNYYDSNGELLTINPGKTFISVFPTGRINDLVFSSEK